ncbi:hypothetical protein F4779DRAFT_633477 [Xylariaceae sp. FL0662B]|nr:hypothetical protein F4779DRAFT_633477 [Xylariaceae sp. FL0662B]
MAGTVVEHNSTTGNSFQPAPANGNGNANLNISALLAPMLPPAPGPGLTPTRLRGRSIAIRAPDSGRGLIAAADVQATDNGCRCAGCGMGVKENTSGGKWTCSTTMPMNWNGRRQRVVWARHNRARRKSINPTQHNWVEQHHGLVPYTTATPTPITTPTGASGVSRTIYPAEYEGYTPDCLGFTMLLVPVPPLLLSLRSAVVSPRLPQVKAREKRSPSPTLTTTMTTLRMKVLPPRKLRPIRSTTLMMSMRVLLPNGSTSGAAGTGAAGTSSATAAPTKKGGRKSKAATGKGKGKGKAVALAEDSEDDDNTEDEGPATKKAKTEKTDDADDEDEQADI